MTAKCPSCGYALAKCAAGAHERYLAAHLKAVQRYQARKAAKNLCIVCKKKLNLYAGFCDEHSEKYAAARAIKKVYQSERRRYPQRKRHSSKTKLTEIPGELP